GAPIGTEDGLFPSTLTCSFIPGKKWSLLPQIKNVCSVAALCL
ncbi:unnamed protein product, partial [Brassica rapa subsp. narinosa]